ncbi:selenoprotein H [Xyrichtys novacula]|uniref:Selenoprotein H n=1 Tax=Xyrichtys novacula TaxID=13765 RepID=A0AAV1FCE9_XYRNO|nr:selenoprotein H [Xyrichtys novacula]
MEEMRRTARRVRGWSLNTVRADECMGPGLIVVLNPEKPRRNSFEISLQDGGKETSLWTGIKKGPPRKLKFPQPDVVVAALLEALKAE